MQQWCEENDIYGIPYMNSTDSYQLYDIPDPHCTTATFDPEIWKKFGHYIGRACEQPAPVLIWDRRSMWARTSFIHALEVWSARIRLPTGIFAAHTVEACSQHGMTICQMIKVGERTPLRLCSSTTLAAVPLREAEMITTTQASTTSFRAKTSMLT